MREGHGNILMLFPEGRYGEKLQQGMRIFEYFKKFTLNFKKYFSIVFKLFVKN
jgi:hypothetical protein